MDSNKTRGVKDGGATRALPVGKKTDGGVSSFRYTAGKLRNAPSANVMAIKVGFKNIDGVILVEGFGQGETLVLEAFDKVRTDTEFSSVVIGRSMEIGYVGLTKSHANSGRLGVGSNFDDTVSGKLVMVKDMTGSADHLSSAFHAKEAGASVIIAAFLITDDKRHD